VLRAMAKSARGLRSPRKARRNIELEEKGGARTNESVMLGRRSDCGRRANHLA